MPDWGRDTRTGADVHVSKAARERIYVCPVCQIRLELRRGSELEYFAHWRGLPGTRACELFSPTTVGAPSATGSQRGTSVAVRPEARVEDSPFDAGLLLDVSDDRWSLALRLPVLQGEDLGELSLADLRPAHVEIAAGQATQRVGALDLLSRDGAARVVVPPGVGAYRTRPGGTWPASVKTNRWKVEVRGLDSKGTLFRLRRGDWTRLRAGSGIHLGESLLVVAEAHPPPMIANASGAERHGHDIISEGRTWRLWELRLAESSAHWLSSLGYTVVPRRWSIASASPARSCTDRREPVYWLEDTVVLALEAPAANARTDAALTDGSNTYGTTVVASEDTRVYMALASRFRGRVRFQVGTASFEVEFSERPSSDKTIALLRQTPRLQVWIGERCFEAWSDEDNRVLIDPREPPEVRVQLGADTVRASVIVWQRGRRRTWRSRSDGEVAKVIEDALAAASLIEVDAENLGRVTLSPIARSARARDAQSTRDDRLEGYARALRLLGERNSADRDRTAVHAVSLIQARLATPRRRGVR